MAEIYIISDWTNKEWMNATESRDKIIVENPANNKTYYFKESIKKFPSKFWSEIIPSQLGQHIGINIVNYEIGIYKDIVGCICEFMITEDEEMIHGVNILKNELKDFKITGRPIVSFQDIFKAMNNYRGYIRNVIDMLIFDSLIGNQDRHSENWAMIRTLNIEELKKNHKKMIKNLMEIYKMTKLNVPFKSFFIKNFDRLSLFDYKFSPVFDSGSSLGREIDERAIEKYLKDEKEILKYIKNGKSEIKWENKNINHFDLLKKIDESLYPNYIKKRIIEFSKRFNEAELKGIITEIDKDVPSKFDEIRLSLQRKELIYNFITVRFKFLKEKFSIED